MLPRFKRISAWSRCTAGVSAVNGLRSTVELIPEKRYFLLRVTKVFQVWRDAPSALSMKTEEKSMRLIAGIALSGLVFIGTIEAQSLAEHAAAAAGATVGTAAGKPMSNAITKIFGQVDDQTKSASRTNVKPVRPAADPTTTGAAGKPSPAGSLAGTEPLPPGPAPSGAAASSGSGSPDELTEPTPARPARSASRRRRQQETASIDAPALPPAPAPVAAPPVPAIPALKKWRTFKSGQTKRTL